MPDREVSGLAFGYPATTVNFEAANEFLAREAKHPGALGQMLINPSMDPEFIRETVQRLGFVGLKPYHLFATEKPTFDAHIPSFLPEEHVRIAHELGLSITLHIVRSQALADPSNQEVLRRYATKYPNARIILAHAARGFNPHHTVVGIESRGFVFGAPLALHWRVPFVTARKFGKLPGATVRQVYSLEYGEDTLELQADALRAGQKVVVVDDLLATGGTARATQQLVAQLGAETVAALFVVELTGLGGRDRLAPLPVHALMSMHVDE